MNMTVTTCTLLKIIKQRLPSPEVSVNEESPTQTIGEELYAITSGETDTSHELLPEIGNWTNYERLTAKLRN